MWEFAKDSPGFAFLMVWVAGWFLTRPFHYAWLAYNRRLRSKNIVSQGWPPPHLDADGDVIERECDCEEKAAQAA